MILDVNVVLAAHRDDHPHHQTVRRWFEELLIGDRPYCVPLTVWSSFLRLATNRRIFTIPTPLADAFDFIEAVHGQPHHLALGPGARHLVILRRICEEAEASGDLVPDAALAAIAVEHGLEVITLDRDFGRFAAVRHRRPAAGEDASGAGASGDRHD